MKKLMVALVAALTAAVSFADPVAKLISKDGATERNYEELQAAFDAAQAGDTVRLLVDFNVTKSITLENKDVVFDLNELTMNNLAEAKNYNFDNSPTVFEITNSVLVVTNGLIYAGYGTAIRSTGKGSHITLAKTSEILGLFVWTLWTTDATVDVYGKIVISEAEGSCLWLTKKGGVINIYDSAELRSYKGDIVRFECPEDESEEEAPTLNVYGGSLYADGYPVVHAVDCMKFYPGSPKSSGRVVIKGGTFCCDNYNSRSFGGFVEIYEGMTYQPLDGECTARFVNFDHGKLVEPDGIAKLCAEGYSLVPDEDGYFSARRTFNLTIVPPENGTLETTYTNMVGAGVAVVVYAIPAEGYVLDAITTNGTALAQGEKRFVMPEDNVELAATFKLEGEEPQWPESWPADADEAVKAKFADWAAANPGADYTLDAVKDAFLMNAKVGETIPAFAIESISVADDAATVAVGSSELDLGTVNGVVYVEGSDELANWAPTVVESVGPFEAGKASVVVEGAKFIKAGVGFANPTPVDR